MNKTIANPKAIHICNSHEPTLRPKIAKEYVLPTLEKMLTKFEIMNEMIKHESTTKAIRNAGKVLNMNIITINKISSKLKVWNYKIPHYA